MEHGIAVDCRESDTNGSRGLPPAAALPQGVMTASEVPLALAKRERFYASVIKLVLFESSAMRAGRGNADRLV